jgi:hypothetical protein
MLTLIHKPRTRSGSIVWLLEELGAPYETKIVSTRGEDGSGSADPANPHPHGKVPALIHDGRAEIAWIRFQGEIQLIVRQRAVIDHNLVDAPCVADVAGALLLGADVGWSLPRPGGAFLHDQTCGAALLRAGDGHVVSVDCPGQQPRGAKATEYDAGNLASLPALFLKIFAWGGIMLALNVPLKRLMAGSKQ